MRFLRRIVSFVAYDVVTLKKGGWDELSGCVLLLAETEPLKAFHVFIDLPPVDVEFIYRFMHKIVENAELVLLHPEQDRVEDWSLGLVTLVKMGVQLLDSERRLDLVKNLLSILVQSANELVAKGVEQFLEKQQDLGARLARAWFDHLNCLSSLEILSIFASTDLEERPRDMAIRRLNLLLSDHTSKKVKIDVPVMRQLQSLLISCLLKEGISESVFKVLGEVVYHVAYEMMNFQDETWFDLRDYIVSQSKTEFRRVVYIFQCLTMPLKDEEFVIPVMEKLLPEISTRLDPPREVLVDNSCWVFAFTGAFCSIIQVIEIPSHAKSVKEIAYKMIDSVRELVERGMEVGLVRRAFRDVENIVKKHLGWIGKSEFIFVKGMLWKLYEIKGMKMESKVVLWRINVVLQRGVAEQFKQLPNPKSELDWINQPED
ncbi:hypothetical protein AALP_AA8G245700 [Arabis alpina]|uniref:DUF577 domain-containing protein n=1 Tax=Arabis alpina TaxID=50452 RepID=A0A087G964_ARAAL|nr:hypothetical protein AALP_AA8G245700 [Arabis alpina]